MNQDPRMAEIFPLPPLVAYKRPPNIREKLIRAKIPTTPPSRPKREVKGMRKCLNCAACPFIKEGQQVQATQSKFKIDINVSANCQTTNCIYLLGCKSCAQQYIGESERSIKERFLEITILEKIFNPDPQFRKHREKMYISKFNTKYKGINRSNGGWIFANCKQKNFCQYFNLVQ